MLDAALAGSAFLMGVAGSLHCAAMCVAPCAAVTGGRRDGTLAFQAGRLIGYAAGGAVVAASVGGLLRWESAAGWLRQVWLAMHLAVLALGLVLAWRAEQPLWWRRLWASRSPTSLGVPAAALTGGGVAWATSGPSTGQGSESKLGRSTARLAGALGAGLAWLAWPCGLLQSALMTAALANGPWQGAGVMAAFAVGSSPGLLAGPWLLARLGRLGRTDGASGHTPAADAAGLGAAGGAGVRWATRLSGGLLAAGALWALGHGVWAQVRAYCG
ncbi:sulfite exporter TauE/SafE family protein [Roseateles chitosanitabidus]|uniref:sulfite exporter TauE/SafE family protein n=1 Tax=Roseateles chitosanitabidus TaxID=65048 RepID=UPI000834BEA4|nr:sulfite exporter TauE/SafE family protein [Roseateles chitosanitabidus]